MLSALEGLEAQPDTLLIRHQFDDARRDHISHGNHILDFAHTFVGQFGNVNQAFKVFFQLHKRAEVHDAGNGSGDHLADMIFFVDCHPRIGL